MRHLSYKLAFCAAVLAVLVLLSTSTAWMAAGSGTVSITDYRYAKTSSMGNTHTFLFTASESMDSGEVQVTMPTGWSAPQGSSGTAGYTTATTTGTTATSNNVLDSGTIGARDSTTAGEYATNYGTPSSIISFDSTTKYQGTACFKITWGNANANSHAYFNLSSSQNWSGYTKVGFWIRSDTTLASGVLEFHYYSAAGAPTGSNELERIPIGALTANTWSFQILTFGATTRTSILCWAFNTTSATAADNTITHVDDLLLGPAASPGATFSGQDAKVRLLQLASSSTVTITYGNGGGASGAAAQSSPGIAIFTVKSRADSGQTLTSLSTQPTVSVTNWESYNDSGRTVQDNSFTNNETTAYMRWTSFGSGSTYNIGYYDSTGGIVVTDNTLMATGGTLDSQVYFPGYSGQAGAWQAVVYPNAVSPPSTYNATDTNIIANDNFNVDASAIPEFPINLASLAVIPLCYGIYHWLRKKRMHY